MYFEMESYNYMGILPSIRFLAAKDALRRYIADMHPEKKADEYISFNGEGYNITASTLSSAWETYCWFKGQS